MSIFYGFMDVYYKLSPPGQTAAVETTVAELVVAAAELEAADAAVDVDSVVGADVDAVDAD